MSADSEVVISKLVCEKDHEIKKEQEIEKERKIEKDNQDFTDISKEILSALDQPDSVNALNNLFAEVKKALEFGIKEAAIRTNFRVLDALIATYKHYTWSALKDRKFQGDRKGEMGRQSLAGIEKEILAVLDATGTKSQRSIHDLFEIDWVHTAVIEAIKKNNVQAVEYLLSLDPSTLNDKSSPIHSLLMYACEYASLDMVKLLLKLEEDNKSEYDSYNFSDTNLTAEDGNGYTAFLYSVAGNNKEVMDFFEAEEPKIFTKTFGKRGLSAFTVAVQHNNISLMKSILAKDSEALKRTLLNSSRCNKNYSNTPFMIAAEFGAIAAMEFILELDPEALTNTHNGWTPLMAAARGGKLPAIKFMLNIAPDSLNLVDQDGTTALHEAAHRGHLETIRYLLERGARLNHVSNGHATELKIAEESGQFKVVEYLRQAIGIFESVDKGNLKEIMEWVSSGNTLNFRDANGNTLLHYALQNNQEEVALFLLKQKPDHGWLDNEGESALQFFVKTKGLQSLANFFQNRLESLNVSSSEDEKSIAETKALEEEFDTLLEYAKENHIVDYEYLARKVDRKYWCDLAKELADSKETLSRSEKPKEEENSKALVESKTEQESKTKRESEPEESSKSQNESITKEEFKAKKEKLSHIIYSRYVICNVAKEGGELAFELGIDPSEQEMFPETDEERWKRLSWAFKFAMEGEAFERAMSITMEMITEKPEYTEVFNASKAALDIRSKDEFVLSLLKLHYKSRQKDTKETSKPSTAILNPNVLAG